MRRFLLTSARLHWFDGEVDNATKFKPTTSQLAVLAAFQDESYLCTAEKACSVIVGLARSTYYRWFDHADFSEWWEREADEFFIKRLPKVKAAVLAAATKTFGRKAGKYNSKAQELFLQRFDKGFVPRSQKRVEHSGGIGVGLDLTNLTDLQLQALARASGISAEDALADSETETPESTGEPKALPGESGDVGDGPARPA